MLQFKTYFLLSEQIRKTDIIDLFILMAMPIPAEKKHQYIAKEVLEQVRTNILGEVQYIILRELRHVVDQSELYWLGDIDIDFDSPEVKNYMLDISKKIFETKINPVLCMKGFLKTFNFLLKNKGKTTIKQLAEISGLPWTIDAIENIFKKLKWDAGYGGSSWAKITAQVKKILDASGDDIFKELERFIDYVHNTGEVLNKFTCYKEGWLKFILDLKQHSLNIRELIPFASRDVQLLFKDIFWREQLMRSSGPGAEESDNIIISLFKKYVKELAKISPEVEKDILFLNSDDADDNYITYYDNVPSNFITFLKEYGPKRVTSVVMRHLDKDPALKRAAKKLNTIFNIVTNTDSEDEDYTEIKSKILQPLRNQLQLEFA